MKIILKIVSALFVSGMLFVFSSCQAAQARFERILGTVCFVNLYEKGREEYYDEIFARLEQIDSEFNLGKADSDLFRINHFASEKAVKVSDDVFSVLEMAQRISELTEGAFDISVEPLVSLWRVNSDSPHVATTEELAERLPLVNFKNIILDSSQKTVKFTQKGMEIDLGGIAKGFAADELVKICKKHKIRRAVIDLGGNVYVYGEKAKNQLWNVGIKNPEFPDSAPLIKITLPEMSVVTSGIYERYFDEGEKRYHHILSPKTGYPIENELYSISVLSKNSMLADALTTAFFVLGTEKSLKILPIVQKEFDSELSAIFIKKNHEILFSENFPYFYSILYEDWH